MSTPSSELPEDDLEPQSEPISLAKIAAALVVIILAFGVCAANFMRSGPAATISATIVVIGTLCLVVVILMAIIRHSSD